MIPEIELKSKTEIKEMQEERLRETLKYTNTHSKFYRNKFLENNIDVNAIKTLEDLPDLPVTTKDDLQKFNADFICVDRSEIMDYSTTSGTTGEPVFFGLTKKDLNRLAYNEAISFSCSTISSDSTIQLMTTMDRCFMAGLAYFLGVHQLGASMIRVGAGIPELQWDNILKFRPDYLVAVPSFLLKMVDYAEKNGIDYNRSSVKGVVCIGEAIRDADFQPNKLTRKILDKWNLELYSTYASTEMSTAFSECEYQIGGHHHPELIIAEILDDDNQPVKEGQPGELVVTTLGVEAMPLIRFKTGDMVAAQHKPCKCGRNTMRLGPVLGRKKQMIKYKGTTIYPPALYDLLNDFDEIEHYVIEIDNNEIGTDRIVIKLGGIHISPELMSTLKDHFRAKLRVAPQIEIVSVEEMRELKFGGLSRKPVSFIDKRKTLAS